MNKECGSQNEMGTPPLPAAAHTGRPAHKAWATLVFCLLIGASLAAVVSLRPPPPAAARGVAASRATPTPSDQRQQVLLAEAGRLAQRLGTAHDAAASTGASPVQLLYSFPAPQGYNPQAGLTLGSDGNLYGSTVLGGDFGDGTLFSVTLQGAITVLHSFNGSDGLMALELVEGTPGTFYGVTVSGGASNAGTVFKISSSGEFSTLYSFDSAGAAGSAPTLRLTLGADGNLYGTTSQGGANQLGTFFKISTEGVMTVLAAFSAPVGAPSALVQAPDGNFYGTVRANDVLFRATPAGVISVIATFGCSPSGPNYGSGPNALLVGQDGNLYGTTVMGCSSDGPGGTLFMATTAGVVTTLASFNTGLFLSGLVQASNGQFYVDGLDQSLTQNLCLYSVNDTSASTTIGGLTQQSCATTGFGDPTGTPLVIGADGRFYGTTQAYSQVYGQGSGTVFAAAAGGTTAPIASFDISNGANPQTLYQAADGTFYGTTSAGGDADSGTLFHLAVDGSSFQNLASFNQSTGTGPAAAPVVTANGTVLGTLEQGGPGGGGAIYSLAPGASTLTDLYSFTSGSYATPLGPLALDAQGNLYGATEQTPSIYQLAPAGTIAFYPYPNSSSAVLADGVTLGSDGNLYGAFDLSFTAFKMTPQGSFTTFATIPRAPAPANEGGPTSAGVGALLQGVDGRFYGVSSTEQNSVVFAVSTSGTAQTLASFTGMVPNAALVQTPDGTLYGTFAGSSTEPAGSVPTTLPPDGTVFSVSPSGQVQTVFVFDGTHGAVPGSLILGKDGALYGTASQGGAYGIGAVFRISVTAAPPVPAGVSAAAGHGSVTLAWNPSSGAVSYNLYQGSTPGGESPTPVMTGITANTATLTGLTNGTPYYFQIAAVGPTATSALSTEVSATPAAAAAVPSITSFTASAASIASGGTVTLTWETQNATACTLNGGGFTQKAEPASGSATSPALTAAASFSLTCSGSGGTTAPSTLNVSVSSSSGSSSSSSSSSEASSSSSSSSAGAPPSSGGGGALGLDLLAALAGAIALRGFKAARKTPRASA